MLDKPISAGELALGLARQPPRNTGLRSPLEHERGGSAFKVFNQQQSLGRRVLASGCAAAAWNGRVPGAWRRSGTGCRSGRPALWRFGAKPDDRETEVSGERKKSTFPGAHCLRRPQPILFLFNSVSSRNDWAEFVSWRDHGGLRGVQETAKQVKYPGLRSGKVQDVELTNPLLSPGLQLRPEYHSQTLPAPLSSYTGVFL
jgi:hypothetical protein